MLIARSLAGILVAALIAAVPGTAQAQLPYDHTQLSPRELVQRSIEAPGDAEKAILRRYVADAYPDTPEGQFAKGWLLAQEDRDDASVAAYRRAVEQDPSFVDAGINLAFALRGAGEVDAAIEQNLRLLEAQADDPNPVVIRNTYFWYRNDKSSEQAERFLRTWEQRLGSDHYLFDYVRGIAADDPQRKAEYYEQAIEKGAPFGAYERLMDVYFDRLSDGRMDASERMRYFEPAMRYSEENPDDPRGLMYIAERARNTFEAYGDAFSFYRQAFERYPTAEAAFNGFDLIANYDFDAALGLLEDAERQLPGNYFVERGLAYAYFQHVYEPETAIRYAQAAVEHAPTMQDRVDQAEVLAEIYDLEGDYDRGLRLYERLLDDAVGKPRRDLLTALMRNRRKAQDFSEALRYLEARHEAGSINESWYESRKAELERMQTQVEARKAFYRDRPFLQRWEARFGTSLAFSVNFATGSATIPEADYDALADVAAALQAPGGDDYVFLIEGHTDSTGSDAVNDPLSERRAEAVAEHLHVHHGIDRSRLRTAGYGSHHPVAPNVTADGRQRNRRTEVRPYGNVTEPEISVTTRLDAERMAVTADGRLAAVGTDPMELWDVRRGIRLRTLGRGGERAFSPNGRYVAALSNRADLIGGEVHALYIYDVKTGLPVAQFTEEERLSSLSWSPFSDAVAYTDIKGYVKVYDLEREALRGAGRAGPVRTLGSTTWGTGGRYLYVSQGRGSTVQVWDAETLAPKRTLDGVNWVHALGQSYDGRYLVAFDNERTMTVWDTRTWERRAASMPFIPGRIVPHPTEPWVLVNDTFDSDVTLALVDLSTMEVLAQRRGAQDLGIGFAPDGRSALVGHGDRIRQMAIPSFAPEATVTGLAAQSYDVEIDTANDYLLSYDDEGTHIWDLTTGKKVHRLRDSLATGGYRATGAASFAAVDGEGRLTTFDTESFKVRREARLGFDATEMHVDGTHLVVAGIDADDDTRGVVAVFDRASLEERHRFSVPFVTEPIQYGGVYEAGFTDVVVRDGLLALSTYWQDGYGRSDTYSRVATVYDLASGRQTADIRARRAITSVAFDVEQTDRLRLGYEGGAHRYTLDGRYERWVPPTTTWRVPLRDGTAVHWYRDRIRYGDRTVRFPETLRDVAVHEDKNLLVAMTHSNEMLFFDLETLTRHLTVAAKQEGEWVAYAPDGTFAASLHGTEKVYWSLGDNLLPFEALKDRFEQPRVLERKLQRIYTGEEVPDDPEQPEIDPDVFDTPYVLSLDSPAQHETEDDTYTLRLSVEKVDADLPDPTFEFVQNGRVIRQRGFEPDPVPAEGERLGFERTFQLDEGFNVIEAHLTYKGARAESQRVEVTRTVRSEPSEPVASTTHLWFFGVGISAYANESQSLEYAHADAEALAEQFKQEEGRLFRKVHTRVLIDEQATAQEIRVAMNDFLREASSEDIIILFIAGHGVQDNTQDLYFIAHDGDLERPYTGLPVDDFRDVLRARPLNQKAMLMLDICHAGTAERLGRRRGRLTAEEAVKQLADGTGTVVFASSTGQESSLEGPQYGGGHGAFTAALLEGLRGEADRAAGNSDGFTSVLELMSYTSRRVPEITNGAQHPTTPLSENVRDFPLSRGQ